MAKFFERIKAQMKEKETAQLLLGSDPSTRPVMFYAEDDYTWNQLGPYVEALTENHAIPVTYVTSDPEDPRLASSSDLFRSYLISDTIPQFLPKVDSKVLVTTMPDLDTYHIKRPARSTLTYAFHSLNSIHMAYRTGAFDAYDVFFCVGPHHREELERHFAAIGKTDATLVDVGYPKLDGIVAKYERYEKRHPEEQTVLIAPTWGDSNLLAVQGEDTIAAVADAGYRVVVRPHPAFFESIYTNGKSVVDAIRKRFGETPNVVIEDSITSEDSFMEADIMVSDWSGAAYEYALGTARPVVFVDVPPKVNNTEWESLGIVPFENRMRSEVGVITPAGDGGAVRSAIDTLLDEADQYERRLTELRSTTVYNIGRAASAGASVIADMVGEA